MKKKKQRWNYGQQTSPEYQKIMINHAEWLDYNYSKEEGDKCRKQGETYKKRRKDER